MLIHQSIARIQSLSFTYDAELEAQFPELYSQIKTECDNLSNLSEYHLMIVHPVR